MEICAVAVCALEEQARFSFSASFELEQFPFCFPWAVGWICNSIANADADSNALKSERSASSNANIFSV